jgi:glycosyltransferase involved in cell wall biosynthesis
MNYQNNGVSIIICCFNSSLKLPQTLLHLSKQVTTIPFEVLIIDNASTDDTFKQVNTIWKSFNSTVPFKVITENKPGLTNARKAGIRFALYDILIFCDDDNLLSHDYVQKAYEKMILNSAIGALGGRSEVLTDIDLPEWWNEYMANYAVGKQASKSGDVSYRKYLWGAGLVVRKSLMEIVFNEKFPFLLTDRNGEELSSGGDSEICARLLLMGYKLWYDAELYFKHYITRNRLTVSYRDKMLEGHLNAYLKLAEYHKIIEKVPPGFSNKLKQTAKYLLKFLLQPFRRNIQINKIKTELSYMWNISIPGTYGIQYYLVCFRKFAKKQNL